MLSPLIVIFEKFGQALASELRKKILNPNIKSIKISDITNGMDGISVFNFKFEEIPFVILLIRNKNDKDMYGLIRNILLHELKKTYGYDIRENSYYAEEVRKDLKFEKDCYLELLMPYITDNENEKNYFLLRAFCFCKPEDISNQIAFFCEITEGFINVDIDDCKNIFYNYSDKRINCFAAAEIDFRDESYLQNIVNNCYESLFPIKDHQNIFFSKIISQIAGDSSLSLKTINQIYEQVKNKLNSEGTIILATSSLSKEKSKNKIRLLVAGQLSDQNF